MNFLFFIQLHEMDLGHVSCSTLATTRKYLSEMNVERKNPELSGEEYNPPVASLMQNMSSERLLATTVWKSAGSQLQTVTFCVLNAALWNSCSWWWSQLICRVFVYLVSSRVLDGGQVWWGNWRELLLGEWEKRGWVGGGLGFVVNRIQPFFCVLSLQSVHRGWGP